MSSLLTQHASSDVEKMVLGNKCDINDKRQVSKDRGEKVRSLDEGEMIQSYSQLRSWGPAAALHVLRSAEAWYLDVSTFGKMTLM